MKSYTITVNGTAYDVTVEETAGGAAPAVSILAPRRSPAGPESAEQPGRQFFHTCSRSPAEAPGLSGRPVPGQEAPRPAKRFRGQALSPGRPISDNRHDIPAG